MNDESSIVLTGEQVAFFKENGYLSIAAITTSEEVARMRRLYDQMFAERMGRETGDQFDLAGDDEEGSVATLPQILGPSRHFPELAASIYHRNALSAARQLLGEEAVFQGDHAILKPAGYGAPTPWHQDEAYWGEDLEYCALSVWMPLQEATIENGCMQFIPHSHRLEVQPHHTINNNPRVHGLEVDELDDSTAVACPLPAGGATFHMSRTFHYAGPNETSQERRAYILLFGHPPKPRRSPRVFPWMRTRHTLREERAKTAQTKDPAAE